MQGRPPVNLLAGERKPTLKENPFESPGQQVPTVTREPFGWFRLVLRTYCLYLLGLLIAFPFLGLIVSRRFSLAEFAAVSVALQSLGALLLGSVALAVYVRTRTKSLLLALILQALSLFALVLSAEPAAFALGLAAWVACALALFFVRAAPKLQLRLRLFGGVLLFQVLARSLAPAELLSLLQPALNVAQLATAFFAFWSLRPSALSNAGPAPL